MYPMGILDPLTTQSLTEINVPEEDQATLLEIDDWLRDVNHKWVTGPTGTRKESPPSIFLYIGTKICPGYVLVYTRSFETHGEIHCGATWASNDKHKVRAIKDSIAAKVLSDYAKLTAEVEPIVNALRSWFINSKG